MARIGRREAGSWAALILLSSCLLAALIFPAGVELEGDSRYYIRGGIHLARGAGFIIEKYEASSDDVRPERITAYPPGTSAVYAALIRSGIHPSVAPTVVSLACWPLFLSGVALFVHRQSGSSTLAAYAIVLASISVPFLEVYKAALSEVLFLPILVAVLIVFTELGRRKAERGFTVGLGAILLGALILSRYVGAFIAIAASGWLFWRRLHEKAYRLCLRELAVLAIPAVPVLFWISRNELIGGSLFGSEIGPRGYTFFDAYSSLLGETTWLVLPSIRRHHVAFLFEWKLVFLYSAPLSILTYWLWRSGAIGFRELLSPPSTPAPVMAALYLVPFAVWTLPFSNLMNTRFMTVLLCLVQLTVLPALARLPSRPAHRLVLGYLFLNFLLLLAGWPVARTEPPEHVLTTHPPRTLDLAVLYPDLLKHLESLDRDLVVLADPEMVRIFAPYDVGTAGDFDDWMANGSCEPSRDITVVALRRREETFYHRRSQRDLEAETLAKCGPVLKIDFRDSSLFHVRALTRSP